MGVDIFLTCQYPSEFDKYLNDEETKLIKNRSDYLNKISDLLAPRYHFIGGENKYYSRKPYLTKKKYICRLIGMANVGSANKFLSAY